MNAYVILGHSVLGLLRGAIFSFHMSLFFILSCVTFRFSKDNNAFVNNSERAFKHLFLSAFGIYILCTVVGLVINGFPKNNLADYFSNFINVFVVGSGSKTKIGDTYVNAIGIPWFLFALFFGRTLFDYLHLRLKSKTFYAAVITCSLLGIFFGKVQWLPFSFDIALAIQPLLLFGYLLKDYDMKKNTIRNLIISIIVWLGLFFLIFYTARKGTGRYLEFAGRIYPYFPICYICAIAGTMSMAFFCQLFAILKTLSKPLKYIGRNSMTMIWIHCIDYIWSNAWTITDSGVLNAVIRVGEDIIVFYLVMYAIKIIHGIKIFERCKN